MERGLHHRRGGRPQMTDEKIYLADVARLYSFALYEEWREIGSLFILYAVRSGKVDRKMLQYVMYKLTREKPDLKHIFPFYWGIDGPFSEPLFILVEELMDNGLIVRDVALPWP